MTHATRDGLLGGRGNPRLGTKPLHARQHCPWCLDHLCHVCDARIDNTSTPGTPSWHGSKTCSVGCKDEYDKFSRSQHGKIRRLFESLGWS